ncbi:MAG: sugar phosphate nucleotidyltransferase [Limisphaerales bacterium]
MKVVIFCGGLGTRLREETEFRPKPMVPVGERPILWHIMKSYAHYGHKEFILCLGYKGEAIKEYFRNYHWNTSDVTLSLGAKPKIKYHNQHGEEDWVVTMIDTGQNTMTGGRLKRVLPYVKDETFFAHLRRRCHGQQHQRLHHFSPEAEENSHDDGGAASRTFR